MDFFFEDGVFFHSLPPHAIMRDPMKGSILFQWTAFDFHGEQAKVGEEIMVMWMMDDGFWFRFEHASPGAGINLHLVDGGFWNSRMHATALALMEGRNYLDGIREATKLLIEDP